MMSLNRAVPENPKVLMKLLEKRQELADILDHESFAAFNMLGTMVATQLNAHRSSNLWILFKGITPKKKDIDLKKSVSFFF